MKITQAFLPKSQYFDETTVKSQIVLHHTCSQPFSVEGDIEWWKTTPERVATHFIVSGDGEIYQTMPLNAWAYSLGIVHPNRTQIEKRNISIEIDSWGQLKYNPIKKIYTTWTGAIVPDNQVEVINIWRGERYFQRYTDAQITAVESLLLYLSKEFNITLQFDVKTLFELSTMAFVGRNTITTHANFRKDKTDVYPCSGLIKMLQKYATNKIL